MVGNRLMIMWEGAVQFKLSNQIEEKVSEQFFNPEILFTLKFLTFFFSFFIIKVFKLTAHIFFGF